jgi:hypothetical protein
MPALPEAPPATGGYYVLPETGTIQRQTNPLLAAGLKASGWAGPYPTMAAAHTAINSGLPQKIKTDAGSLTGINAIGSFFNRLTSKNTWLRTGEFVLGGMFAYVAVKAMFPGAASSVTQPAKRAAKSANFAIAKKAVTKGII